MSLQSHGNGAGLDRVRFSDGTIAERFVLQAGDCPSRTGDCQADRERLEFFEVGSTLRPTAEVWHAWSVYLSSDFAVPPGGPDHYVLTLGQIHQFGTSGPELLFHLDHRGYWAHLNDPYQLDDDPMHPVPVFRRVRVANATDLIGRWMRVMVQANWSRSESGFINVWINGNLAWQYQGATPTQTKRSTSSTAFIGRSCLAVAGHAQPRLPTTGMSDAGPSDLTRSEATGNDCCGRI